MTFSPAAFNAVINANKGFLKFTRYRIRFPIPQILFNNTLAPYYYNSLRTMEFYTDTFQFPGMGFLTRNVVRYGYGPSEKKPFAAQFGDVLMTVYNDSTATNLDFFHDWMQRIENTDMSSGINGSPAGAGSLQNNAYELSYKDEYAVDGQITLLNDIDEDVVTIRMRQMYPIFIPEFQLGWAIKQDIQRFTVNFAFTDWYTDWSAGGTLLDNKQQALAGGGAGGGGGLGQPPGQPENSPTSNDGSGAGGLGTTPPQGQVDIGLPEDGGVVVNGETF